MTLLQCRIVCCVSDSERSASLRHKESIIYPLHIHYDILEHFHFCFVNNTELVKGSMVKFWNKKSNVAKEHKLIEVD